jgi:outer membrane protein OmpA-like peptidoglycan-associated protein
LVPESVTARRQARRRRIVCTDGQLIIFYLQAKHLCWKEPKMLSRMTFSTALALLWLGAAGLPGVAQERTDAELGALFRNQIDLFDTARTDPQAALTRGLVLSPVAPSEANPAPAATASTAAPAPTAPSVAVAEPQAPATLGTGAPAPTLDLTQGTTAPGAPAPPVATVVEAAPLQHGILPRDQQVNVQVRFAFDSAALADDQKPVLLQLCRVMEQEDIQLFRIIGHTDASGSLAYNQNLSLLRAREVKRFFTDECGIAENRLEAIGVGPQFLYNAEDPLSGENRRVEFQAMS